MIIIVVFVIDDNIGDLIMLFVIIVIYIDKFSVFFSKLVYLVNLICSFSNLICIYIFFFYFVFGFCNLYICF